MSRLLLLRHAKSDWNVSGRSDHDRPLNERGRGDAPRMGACLARKGLVPDRVLCSTALRTRETLDLVLAAMGASPPVTFTRALYEAGPGDVLGLVRSEGGDAATLLVVGHNPATEEAARRLSGTGNAAALALMAGKFPTAAFAEIDFRDTPWPDIAWGGGDLHRFVRPKDLD